jgi:hypothetical protein
MPDRSPGEHPLTDILVHRRSVFDPGVDRLVRELHRFRTFPEMDALVDWLSPPPAPELEKRLRDALRQARREVAVREEE